MDPLYWSLILVGAGLAVIVLELFIPSAGVLGLIAGIFLISGVIVGFIDGLNTGLVMLLAVLIIVPVMFSIMVKAWPHTPLGRRILIGPVQAEDVVPAGEFYEEIRSLVGQLGVARTPMLPSGVVMIGGRKYDAVSNGIALEVGETVKVTKVEGNRIVVAKYDGESADESGPRSRDGDILSQPLEELGLDPIDDPLT